MTAADNPWHPHGGYHEALFAAIRDGTFIDPDLWLNPVTD